MKWMTVGLMVGVLAMGTTGCGDDGSDANGGGDTGGSSSSGGSPSSGGNAPTIPECDPQGAGECQNETDCPFVLDGTATSTSNQCGFACLGDDDRIPCIVDCFETQTGMTTECSTCFAELVSCVADNCLIVCSTNQQSAECESCRIEAGCDAEYRTCTGLE